jgi:hypothetical protein
VSEKRPTKRELGLQKKVEELQRRVNALEQENFRLHRQVRDLTNPPPVGPRPWMPYTPSAPTYPPVKPYIDPNPSPWDGSKPYFTNPDVFCHSQTGPAEKPRSLLGTAQANFIKAVR